MVVITEMGVREITHHHYQLAAIVVDLDVADVGMGGGKYHDDPLGAADLHALMRQLAVEHRDQAVSEQRHDG